MNGKNIGTITLSWVWKCGAGFEQTIVVEFVKNIKLFKL